MYEQLIRLRDDKLDKTAKDNDTEKQHMIKKLNELANENETLKEERTCFKLELEQRKEKIDLLNKQIEQANDNYEKLLNELNQFRLSIDQSLKCENDRLKNDLKIRNEQNEKLKNEFDLLATKLHSNLDYSSQQDKLIKQLKQIQNDLQNTIKTQKNTYDVFENENLSLKQMYEQISKKYEESLENEKEKFKQEKSAEIIKSKLNEKSQKELIKAQKYEIDQLKLQIDLQLEKLHHKEFICEELKKKVENLETKVKNFHKNFNSL